MPYDEGLAERLREILAERPDVAEKRMFGGLVLMVDGHMCCGVLGDDLLVRAGPEGYQPALRRPHTREMDFTGRPLTGFVFVDPPGFESDRDLEDWVRLALDFVATLPPR